MNPNWQPSTWLEFEILNGLTMISMLGLPYSPPSDMIVLTAYSWSIAFKSFNISWVQDADTQRIRKTFSQLAGKSDRFPNPKQFHELLGAIPRAERTKIAQIPISEAERVANLKRFKSMVSTAFSNKLAGG